MKRGDKLREKMEGLNIVLFMRGCDQLMEEIKKKHKVVFLKKGA